MIPGAGLYLPETLHRWHDHSPPPPRPPKKDKPLKNIQSHKQRHTRHQRTARDRASVTNSRKPFTGPNARSLQSLASDLTAIDVCPPTRSSLVATSVEDLTRDIRRDISEASRLYCSATVSSFLKTWPDKRKWVDKTLMAARNALDEVGMDISPARLKGETGKKVPPKLKFEWFQSNHKRILKKQQHLKKCRHDLSGAIHVMQTIELCRFTKGSVEKGIFEAPSRPWVSIYEKDTTFDVHLKEDPGPDQENASISISTLSDNELENQWSSRSTPQPAELLGSIPGDDTCPSSPGLYTLPDILLADDITRQNTLKNSHTRSIRKRVESRTALPPQLPHMQSQSSLIEAFLEWVATTPITEQGSSNEEEESSPTVEASSRPSSRGLPSPITEASLVTIMF